MPTSIQNPKKPTENMGLGNHPLPCMGLGDRPTPCMGLGGRPLLVWGSGTTPLLVWGSGTAPPLYGARGPHPSVYRAWGLSPSLYGAWRRPRSRLPLPVDTGRGRDSPCSSWPAPPSLAWGSHAVRGTPHTVVSSAERGRQCPALGLAFGVAGSTAPREEDTQSLHTDVQEVDREQDPPSLSS